MKLCVIYLFILYSTFTVGQDYRISQIEEEVLEINKSTLYKSYRYYDIQKGYILTDNIDHLLKQITTDFVYSDEKGRIRKIIFRSEEDGFITSIYYFDNQGYLLYKMSCDICDGITISSKMYYDKGKLSLYRGKIIEDLVEKPLYFSYTSLEQEGIISLPSCTTESMSDFNFTHIDSIAPIIGNDFKSPSIANKVKFESPKEGDYTTISSYDVNIRERPNLDGKVVGIIGEQSIKVKVLMCCTKDLTLKEYPWYEIEYIDYSISIDGYRVKGYIYGAFLEPVEKEVK